MSSFLYINKALILIKFWGRLKTKYYFISLIVISKIKVCHANS